LSSSRLVIKNGLLTQDFKVVSFSMQSSKYKVQITILASVNKQNGRSFITKDEMKLVSLPGPNAHKKMVEAL
jgi:hypothetical protein